MSSSRSENIRLSPKAQDPSRFPDCPGSTALVTPIFYPHQPALPHPWVAWLLPCPGSPPPTVTKTEGASRPYFPIPKSTVTFHANHRVGPFLSLFRARFMRTPLHLFWDKWGRCAVYYPYKPAPFFLSLPFKRAFLFDWTRKGTLRGELTLSPLYCPINTCPVKGWVGSREPWSMRTFNPSGKCKVALNTIKGQISIYSPSKPGPSPLMHRTVWGC